jgi:hypothetical protein
MIIQNQGKRLSNHYTCVEPTRKPVTASFLKTDTCSDKYWEPLPLYTIKKGKIATLIFELCTEDQFRPSTFKLVSLVPTTFKLVSLVPKLLFLGQIGPCVDVVLYISIRQMLNVPFTLSSCWSNIYVLI